MRTVPMKIDSGFQSGGDYAEGLIRQKFKIGRRAEMLLREKTFVVAKRPEGFNLAIVSFEELGFKPEIGFSLAAIYEKAEASGLNPCMDAVAPELRLKLKTQAIGDILIVAVESSVASDEQCRIFELFSDKEGNRWLTSFGGSSKDRLFGISLDKEHPMDFKRISWVFEKR